MLLQETRSNRQKANGAASASGQSKVAGEEIRAWGVADGAVRVDVRWGREWEWGGVRWGGEGVE